MADPNSRIWVCMASACVRTNSDWICAASCRSLAGTNRFASSSELRRFYSAAETVFWAMSLELACMVSAVCSMVSVRVMGEEGSRPSESLGGAP